MRTAIGALLGLAAAIALTPSARAAGGGRPDPRKSMTQAEKRVTTALSYLPVFGLSATLTFRSVPSGLIMADAGLDIPDAAFRDRVALMEPRVRDAMRVALAEYASVFHREGAAPDAEQLVRLMQRSIDRTLGQPGAKVLLANLMMQRR